MDERLLTAVYLVVFWEHSADTWERTVPDEPIHVLVIDDDPAIVEMIRMGLEADGMKVFGAADGGEGVDVLGRERIDVVLLDIMMPRVDGWMTLMDIRNNPATADVPVIMLTAKTQDLAKILAFKQGVQQYVTKPFNIMELSARVESLTRGRRRMPVEFGVGGGGLPQARGAQGRSHGTAHDRRHRVPLGAKQVHLRTHLREPVSCRHDAWASSKSKMARESFSRVHRSYLVNLNKVKEILRVDGCYVVVAADRDETHVPVARRQVRAFREAVGI